MSSITGKKPRPLFEDYLRALGYLNLAGWALLFYLFPPIAFVSELAEISRTLWLSIAFVGGLMAMFGALFRIDIKLEFPGLLLAMVGPLFYTVSQLYLSVYPAPTDIGVNVRWAITAYAFLGITLLLPRTVGLLVEKNRLKGLSK